ncbi:DUF6602 domain-containing protein [Aeromonas veronii]|uniref:DUF6602 domain-containing protein n=1 Tax=Aeromonas veronii TaxID=654 RepID=UPI001116560F|nr:DUF6602 domain-containing protein [Aeromonas veronii]
MEGSIIVLAPPSMQSLLIVLNENTMAKYSDIFSLNAKYLSVIAERSYFIHQYLKNTKGSGDHIEEEVRGFLKMLLPERYKVTHGHIAYANSKQHEPVVSPQADIIIVDTMVPHSLFYIDQTSGMEIVPKECVVGVLEVKRTLNSISLKGSNQNGAIYHIEKIKSSANLTKDNPTQYLPGGISVGAGLTGGVVNNPIFGVIGLKCDKDLFDPTMSHFQSSISSVKASIGTVFDNLDFLYSFDGELYATGQSVEVGSNFSIINVRSPQQAMNYVYNGSNSSHSTEKVLAKFVGFLLAYLQNVGGISFDIEKYLFNDSIK